MFWGLIVLSFAEIHCCISLSSKLAIEVATEVGTQLESHDSMGPPFSSNFPRIDGYMAVPRLNTVWHLESTLTEKISKIRTDQCNGNYEDSHFLSLPEPCWLIHAARTVWKWIFVRFFECLGGRANFLLFFCESKDAGSGTDSGEDSIYSLGRGSIELFIYYVRWGKRIFSVHNWGRQKQTTPLNAAFEA